MICDITLSINILEFMQLCLLKKKAKQNNTAESSMINHHGQSNLCVFKTDF